MAVPPQSPVAAGLLWQEERRLPAHCAASKDVADQLTSPFAVLVASPFAAGAQVQCGLLAACIRGAVDGQSLFIL